MNGSPIHPSAFKKHWLLLAILALTIYGIVPQLGSFDKSLALIEEADLSYVALALVPFLATYFAAAGNYYFLALKPLNYLVTVAIQLAGMFINRLLPAGLGALGINYLYLRQRQHSGAQAAVIVGLNNTIGFIGHSLLVALGLLLAWDELPTLNIDLPFSPYWLLFLLSLVVLIAFGLSHRKLRRWTLKALHTVRSQLIFYKRRPARLLATLMCSVALTLCHVITLWLCLQAVGADLSLVAILIVLGLGVAVGSAAPTPGGLGGVEAGLVAGFVAFQVPADVALAAVLIYRLITYWLALAIGALSFIACQRRGLLQWPKNQT